MSGCLVVWLPGGRSGGLWYSDLPGRETVRLGVRILSGRDQEWGKKGGCFVTNLHVSLIILFGGL